MIEQMIVHQLSTSGSVILALLVLLFVAVPAFFLGRLVGWWRYERKIASRMGAETRELLRNRAVRIECLEQMVKNREEELGVLRAATRGCLSLLTSYLGVPREHAQENRNIIARAGR
jgi:hypothetical protein